MHNAITTVSFALAIGLTVILLARRFRIPAIAPLLVVGIVLGQEGLGLIQPDDLGETLRLIVALSVAIILFEGGLSLDPTAYKAASKPIRNLLSLGVFATWLVTAAAIWLIVGLDILYSLLASSLVIVTGPTVVLPILRRVRLKRKVATILHWEGVLIDPIGVFIAVLCFELATLQNEGAAFANLAIRIGAGAGVGVAGGWLLLRALHRRWVPDERKNMFLVAAVVGLYGLAESVLPETGLLASTLAGAWLGWKGGNQRRHVREFKEELADLLIGLLFILLAARLDLEAYRLFGWEGFAVVALVVFFVRPLSVVLCSWGTNLDWREQAFLSWLAPRGIVAASMASLFALSLGDASADFDAQFLELFTFAVIAVTVLLQGLSASVVARALNLAEPEQRGWLIVGATRAARALAAALREGGAERVFLVDANASHVASARQEGFEVARADALKADEILEEHELEDIGYFVALTDNAELNVLAADRWRFFFGAADMAVWADESDPSAYPSLGMLPRPSVLDRELREGRAAWRWVPSAELRRENAKSGSRIPVVWKDEKGSFSLAPPAGEGEEQGESEAAAERSVLVVQRQGGSFLRSLVREKPLLIRSESLQEVYDLLCKEASRLRPSLSSEKLKAELLARDKTLPSFIGHGVAFPHAFSDRIDASIALLAVMEKSLNLEGLDEPIELFIFLVSPSGNAEERLDIIAEAARLCRSPQGRKTLASYAGANPEWIAEM